MSHFAEIKWDDDTRKKGEVVKVIIAEQDYINSGVVGDSFDWVQTSINTSEGVHSNPDKLPLRKNFGVKGMIYDKDKDAFYFSKPYPSWTFDEQKCIWEAPVPRPNDGVTVHTWNEDDGDWEGFIP